MSAQSELTRLRCLKALGIVPLVARRPLAGAAPTQRLRLRQTAPPPAALSPRPPSPGPSPIPAAKEQSRQVVSDIRNTLTDAAAAPVQPTAEPDAGPDSGATAAGTRFSLALVAAGDRLWVEQLQEGLFAREQMDLIGAMAAALMHPQRPADPPTLTQFDWPLHGNRQLDLGPAEAAASLASFVNRQAEERRSVEVVALGEATMERLRVLPLSCALRPLPSTHAMLEQPLLKRDAWVRLRS